MAIGIFGESCTGKSTLAAKLKEHINTQVYTGRDYLRLEKNEAAALQSFRTKHPCFGNRRPGGHKNAVCRAYAW